jgi:hypothetical protein
MADSVMVAGASDGVTLISEVILITTISEIIMPLVSDEEITII